MAVTKLAVKTYLSRETAMADKLKGTLDSSDRWDDFKTELVSSIVDYSKQPTREGKKEITNLILRYSTSRSTDANDYVNAIIRDLGIRERDIDGHSKPVFSHQKSGELADFYRRIGVTYVDTSEFSKAVDRQTSDRKLMEYRKKYHDKFRYIREQKSVREELGIKPEKKSTRRTDKKPEKDKSGKQPEKKEDGKIKKTLKLGYFKLTSRMLNAPGEVPPELLSKNKRLITKSTMKLDKVLEDLSKAKQTLSGRNSRNENIPEDIADTYGQMSRGELDEEGLANFEETLDEKGRELLDGLKGSVQGIFKKEYFAEELRKFGQERLTDIPESELEEEIQYALQDATLDESGKLVLPKYSIFQSVVFDEKGEIRPGQENIVKLFSQKAEMDRLTDLSDAELIELSRQLALNRSKTGEIDLPTDSKGYKLTEFIKANPDIVDFDNLDVRQSEIEEDYGAFTATQNVAEEVQVTHKMLLASQVKGQLAQLRDIVRGYDSKERSEDGLSRSDSKKREIALKMARRKVDALNKAGLSKVISEGEKSSKGVIKRARGLLLPELENARDKDQRRFDKTFSEPEGPENPDRE